MNNTTTDKFDTVDITTNEAMTDEMTISGPDACKLIGIGIGALGGIMAANATPVTRVIIGLTALGSMQSTYKRALHDQQSNRPVREKSCITEMGSGVIGMCLVSSLTNFMFGK